MSYVYFLFDSNKNAIKIGSSLDIARRCRELQIGNACNLKVLGRVPGTKKDEKLLQDKFWHLHIRGEWFRAESELTDFIAAAIKQQKTDHIFCAKTDRGLFYDLAFLKRKFLISDRRVHKLIRWIRNSHFSSGVDLMDGFGKYSIFIENKSKHHAMNFYYNSGAISIIEKNIPLYAERHPRAQMCYTWVDENISIDNEYLLRQIDIPKLSASA